MGALPFVEFSGLWLLRACFRSGTNTRIHKTNETRQARRQRHLARSEEPRAEREAREARDEEQGDQKRDSRHENANEPVSALYDGRRTVLQEVCAVYQAGIKRVRKNCPVVLVADHADFRVACVAVSQWRSDLL